MIENLDKLTIRLIKLVRAELSDTKEEGSDFKGLGVRVVRSIKPRSI